MMKLVVVVAFCSVSAVFCTPLDDYVHLPDSHYEYNEAWQPDVDDRMTIYYLNMTSQKWLTEAEVNRPIWWHIMCVIVPHDVKYDQHAFLYITGGDNHNEKPSPSDQELSLISAYTLSTKMIGAILYQIPNQPLKFTNDPLNKSRSEDAIIALTWYKFLEDPKRPEWLLRLPMTKAAVRALDTITDIVMKKKSLSISKFFVAGASKRGWTTWTTAAVDKRVIGIAPIVLDVINVQDNFRHIWRSYGNWSFALDDYYDMNVTLRLFDPAFEKVTAIVDPIAYADRLTMPKYIISTTGDEFQMPDDTLFYGRTLPGKTYYRMIPNAEHSCAGHAISIFLGLQAFFISIVENSPLPPLNWTMTRNAKGGSITLHSPTKPSSVTMWHGKTIDGNFRRDFRLLCASKDSSKPTIHPVFWKGNSVSQNNNGEYVAEMKNPREGWSAFFIQVTYPALFNDVMMFTTQVNIIPDTFPYPDCHGEGCRGNLI